MPVLPAGAEHTNVIKLGSLHDVRWCQYLWKRADVVPGGAAVKLDHELFRLQAQCADHGFLALPLLKSRKTSALPVPKGMVALYIFSISEEDPLAQNLAAPSATSINKGHALDADENGDVVRLLFQAIILSLERLLHKDQLLRIGDCFYPRHNSFRSVGGQGARLRPFLIRSTDICVRVHAVDNPYQLLSCPGYDASAHTHAQLVPTGDLCEIVHPSREGLGDTGDADTSVFSSTSRRPPAPNNNNTSNNDSTATAMTPTPTAPTAAGGGGGGGEGQRVRPACLETWAHAAPHLCDAVAAAPANMVRVRLQGVVGVYPQQLLAVPRRDEKKKKEKKHEQQHKQQTEAGAACGESECNGASADVKTVADRLWHRATTNGIAEGGLILNSIAALNKRYGQLSATITIPPPPPRPAHPGPHARLGPHFRAGGRPLQRAPRPPAKFPWGRQPKHARKQRHRFTLSLVKQQLQAVVGAGQAPDASATAVPSRTHGDSDPACAATHDSGGDDDDGDGSIGASAEQHSARPEAAVAGPGAVSSTADSAPNTGSADANEAKRAHESGSGHGPAASKRGKTALGSVHDAVPAMATGRRAAPDLLTPPYQDEDTLKPLLLQGQGPDDAAASASVVLPTTPSSPPFAAALAPLAVGGTIKYPVPDAYKPLPCKAEHSDTTSSWTPDGEGVYVDNLAMKGYQLHARPKPPPPALVTFSKRKPHEEVVVTPPDVRPCEEESSSQREHSSAGHCEVQWQQQPTQGHARDVVQSQEHSQASAQLFAFVQYLFRRGRRGPGEEQLPSRAVTRADALLLEASCHLQLCDQQPLVPYVQYTRHRYTDTKHANTSATPAKRQPTRDSAACARLVPLLTHARPFAAATRLSLSELLPQSKPLVAPHIAVKTVMPTKQRDAVVTVGPSASTLWYHLGLRPYTGSKDWAAVPLYLCSDTHRPTAAWFVQRIVSAYAALNLGSITLHTADGLSRDPKTLSPPEVTQALRDLKARLKQAAGREPPRLLLLVVTDDGEWPPALAHPSAPEALFPLAHVLMMRRDMYLQPNTHLNAACYQLFRLNEAQHSAHKPMLQLAPTDLDADWVVALNTKLAFKQSLHLLHCAFVVLQDALAVCLTDRHGSLLDVNFHEFTTGHALADAATAASTTLLRVVRALRRPVHVLLCGLGPRATEASASLRKGMQPGPPPPSEPKAGYLVSCTCVWFEWDDGFTVERGPPPVSEAKLARLKQLREQKQQELEKRKQEVQLQRQRQQGKLGGMLRSGRGSGTGTPSVSSLGNFKAAGGRGGSSTLERYLRPGVASSRPMQSPHLRRHRSSNSSGGNGNGNNGNGKRTERELLPLLPDLLQGTTRTVPRMFVGTGAYFDASAAVRTRRGHVQALYTLDERQWYRVTLLWRERASEEVITAHMTPRDFPLEDDREEGVLEFVVQQFHHLAHLALPSGRPTVPVHVRSLSAFVPPLWEPH